MTFNKSLQQFYKEVFYVETLKDIFEGFKEFYK